MLDGRPLIDAHVHAARLPTLKPAWRTWADQFGDITLCGVWQSAEYDSFSCITGAGTRMAPMPRKL